MAIAFSKYVDIVSGVAGANVVATRELIGRLFTNNNLLPPQSFAEFDSAADVGTYFGTSSNEYLRALFYFGWISKTITAPKKISFARWVSTAVAPMIFSNKTTKLLATFNAITAGSFTLSLGGVSNVLSAINLSGAASLTAVAAAIQAKINAQSGVQWTGATVSYDATTHRFNFVGGSAVTAAIALTDGAQNVAAALGWLTDAILADGSAVETIGGTLDGTVEASDNFGSFLFMPTLTLDQVTQAATWNDGQNVKYQFCQAVAAANAATWSAALIALAGTSLTLNAVSTEYPEQLPMMILAATDYTRRNATQNYMFQQANLTPSVFNTTDSDTYDALRVNYYGQTQTAGNLLSFYQRGLLMGGTSAPIDMNTYANEQWLKDAAGAAVMALLLALPEVSANVQGRSEIMTQLQSVVDSALFNGAISVGKTLTAAQKLAVYSATGDGDAWYQVQNSGYWLDVVIAPYSIDGRTEYQATYTLVYSKDDVVRKVEGTHVLI